MLRGQSTIAEWQASRKHARHLCRFRGRRRSSSSPAPFHSARADEHDHSRDASAPEFCLNFLPPRSRTGGVLCPSSRNEGRRSADRRTSQCPHHTNKRCRLNVRGRGGPLPSLPRKRGREGRGLASRRSTAALAKAFTSWLSFGPRFPGLGRVLPALTPLQRAPRGPVVVPAGRGPEAARERSVSFRARAPLSLRVREYPREGVPR